MSTKILGIIALGAVAVIAAAFFLRMPAAPAAADTSAAGTPAAATSTGGSTPAAAGGAQVTAGYTLAQVTAHSGPASCWTAINGKVYDVTQWINQHPGGAQAILSLCGTDGSSAFNGQHGGQRRPESELAQFYLAPLAQ